MSDQEIRDTEDAEGQAKRKLLDEKDTEGQVHRKQLSEDDTEEDDTDGQRWHPKP